MKRHFLLCLIVASFSLTNAYNFNLTPEMAAALTQESKKRLSRASFETKAYECLEAHVAQSKIDPRFYRLIENYIHQHCMLIEKSLKETNFTEQDFTTLREEYFEKIKQENINVFKEILEYRKKQTIKEYIKKKETNDKKTI